MSNLNSENNNTNGYQSSSQNRRNNNNNNNNNNNTGDRQFNRVLAESREEFERDNKPPDNFEYYYQCQPIAYFPWYSDEKHKGIEYSNRVILPENILKDLSKLENGKELYIFKISNENMSVIITPSEFVMSEVAYLPNHILQQLKSDTGDVLKIELLEEDVLKGETCTLLVEQPEYLKIQNVKEMLENSIISHYSAIQQGERILIYSDELDMELSFIVKECTPTIMSITDSDLEVHFDIPEEFFPPKAPVVIPVVIPVVEPVIEPVVLPTNNLEYPGIGNTIDESPIIPLSKKDIRNARLRRFNQM